MLSYSIKQMLAKFEKMVFSELFDLICAFYLVRIATTLDCKRIYQPKVSKDAKTGAVAFVFFIAELAVIVLEIGGQIVDNHWETLDNLVVSRIFVYGAVTEN